MKPTEFYRWWVPDERKPGKLRLTKYMMTREQAAEAFPGAEPNLATREVRDLPENEQEVGQSMHNGGRSKTS